MKALKDQAEFIEENRRSTRSSPQSSGNQVMEIFWSTISILAAGEQDGISYTAGNQQHVIAAHQAIVDALRARDPSSRPSGWTTMSASSKSWSQALPVPADARRPTSSPSKVRLGNGSTTEEPRPEPAKATHCVAPVRRPERASAEAEGGRASPSVCNPRAPAWQVRLRACRGQAGARGFVDGQIREVNAAPSLVAKPTN